MASIIVSVVLLFAAVVAYFLFKSEAPRLAKASLFGGAFLAAVVLLMASIAIVSASNVGVVTVFGKVQNETLGEGIHFVGPIASVHEVYAGVQFATIPNSEAGSKDLQAVHTAMTVNFRAVQERARDLYALNTSLNYAETIVPTATVEVFKSVVAQYTAEELITKRSEVSDGIVRALSAKLAPYFLSVRSIQMVNFGFSKAFDAAIEEKVTASQKAATAQRNLERVKYEAEARITQARGEAEAISIQADSVSKNGGEQYVRLKAVEKWNGVLPAYVTGGAAMPFIGIK